MVGDDLFPQRELIRMRDSILGLFLSQPTAKVAQGHAIDHTSRLGQLSLGMVSKCACTACMSSPAELDHCNIV
jgi:hypothetical protein